MAEAKKIRPTRKDTNPQQFVTLLRWAYDTMLSWKTKTSTHRRFILLCVSASNLWLTLGARVMNWHSAQAHLTEGHQTGSAENTRLHGRQLIIARSVWVTLVVLTLAVFFVLYGGYVALEAGQVPQALSFSAGGSFAATLALTVASM